MPVKTKEDTENGLEQLDLKRLLQIARESGTPCFVIDHEKIRQNYKEFKEALPRVQAYYAVKANSNPEIVKTLYKMGASFDVASFPEFMVVYEYIKTLPEKERRQNWRPSCTAF